MDLHHLLQRLNAPPFSLGLTIIAFSEKTPQELLQLLSDVLARVSPKALQKAPGQESPEQAAERLALLLRMVKYPLPQPNDPASFKQALAQGDRDVLHGVLKWVLAQGQQLEKRAFVGFYLSWPEMPDELFYDPQAMELRAEIKALQAEFVDAHKALDAAQEHVRELPVLRAQIKQMEGEKERLGDKVDKAAAQAAGLPDAASYQAVCVALRQDHDREVSISQQLMAQQQHLERAEGACQRTTARLHEMQQQLQSHGGSSLDDAMDGSRLLDVLRDDVARLRLQVSSQWPRELEAKQSRLAAVQATLNNGINTEGDLQRLLAHEGSLSQQIAAAQERLAATERSRAADRAYLPVRQAQQMCSLVGRKKAELGAKVQRLQERQAALSAVAAAADGGGTSSNGASAAAGGVISDADWRSKYEAVKAQLPVFKAMKRELAELEAEVHVLQQTEEVVRQQDPAGGAAVPEVYAAADAPAALASASAGGDDQGEGGGTSLQQVAAAIKAHKAQLAPAIQELRALRTQQQELEATHAERKALYEAALGGLEGSVASLSNSVAALQAGVSEAEAELGKMRSRVGELEGVVQRITALGGDELKRRCQAQLRDADAALQKLREQQRLAEERSGSDQAQLATLSGLLQVLGVKQQLAAEAAAAGGGAGCNKGGRDMLPAAGRWAPAGGAGGSGVHTNVMVL